MDIKIIGDDIFYNGYKVATINADATPSHRVGFVDTLEDLLNRPDTEGKYIDLVDSLVDPSVLDDVIDDVRYMENVNTKAERREYAEEIVSRIENIQNDIRYCLDMVR